MFKRIKLYSIERRIKYLTKEMEKSEKRINDLIKNQNLSSFCLLAKNLIDGKYKINVLSEIMEDPDKNYYDSTNDLLDLSDFANEIAFYLNLVKDIKEMENIKELL